MAGTAHANNTLIPWLLESDPSIRWQVLQDLAGAPADEVAAERARVATDGWGAQLLALQDADGRWGGAAWNRGWNSTMHVLMLLRDMGLDPASDAARRAVGLVRERVTWRGCGPPECDDHAFFDGEVEPCINGQVAAAGAYFRQDVRNLIDRLLGEQLADGAAFPTWWHSDMLRGLDYLRRGVAPDERTAEAIALVASKRDADGRWPVDTVYPGVMPVDMDQREGRPDRWMTLRATRVVQWYAAGG